MRVIIDICHPAHVHFFYNPYRKLLDSGHEVLVTSRNKDVTLQLLELKGIDHQCLSVAPTNPSFFAFIKELIVRDFSLRRILKSFRPHVITAIGGTFAAHAALLTKTKSVIFYDTENAKLQNLITYPFVSELFVPNCYTGWTPESKTKRYHGYHELSYLHSNYFKPNRELALQNGVQPGRKNFFLRIVSWCANHDISESGWSDNFLEKIVDNLLPKGNVIISSERPLPTTFQKYIYTGDVNQLHHVLAHCDLFIGESATLASESVVLGVPAIYIANTSRGYIDEQQSKYKLVSVIDSFDLDRTLGAIDKFFSLDASTLNSLHQTLLDSNIDVAEFVFQKLIHHGQDEI